MVSNEIFKQLENVKEDKVAFEKLFVKIITEKLALALHLLELDITLDFIISKEYDRLRILLDDMTAIAKYKVLDAIDKGDNDPIYEKRYRSIKEVSDLINYYIDERE